MPFSASFLLYKDYDWSEKADDGDPYYLDGADHSELNKYHGNEVLYFLNHLAKKRWTSPLSIADYKRLERMLREQVPAKSTHKEAEEFITSNWNK